MRGYKTKKPLLGGVWILCRITQFMLWLLLLVGDIQRIRKVYQLRELAATALGVGYCSYWYFRLKLLFKNLSSISDKIAQKPHSLGMEQTLYLWVYTVYMKTCICVWNGVASSSHLLSLSTAHSSVQHCQLQCEQRAVKYFLLTCMHPKRRPGTISYAGSPWLLFASLIISP